jgi:glycosyltransferase involved in cell wall biosynthesis
MFKFKDIFHWEKSNRPQMEKVIKNANRIISISQNTKKDLVDILQINPDKVDVIHHGFNKAISANKNNLFGKFILFVGSRERYKNFKPFVRAISKLLIKENGLKLVCVGLPFNKEELAELRKLNILEYMDVLTVNEKKLNNLYSNAEVFVYPSLYEGFGMPILEAFANNCPVCLSNTSCFPEIAGDAGAYFDPYNIESILETVTKVLYSNDLKKQLIKAGNERLDNFSWKKTAQETTISYKKTL